jgi:hypothetical protein
MLEPNTVAAMTQRASAVPRRIAGEPDIAEA